MTALRYNYDFLKKNEKSIIMDQVLYKEINSFKSSLCSFYKVLKDRPYPTAIHY